MNTPTAINNIMQQLPTPIGRMLSYSRGPLGTHLSLQTILHKIFGFRFPETVNNVASWQAWMEKNAPELMEIRTSPTTQYLPAEVLLRMPQATARDLYPHAKNIQVSPPISFWSGMSVPNDPEPVPGGGPLPVILPENSLDRALFGSELPRLVQNSPGAAYQIVVSVVTTRLVPEIRWSTVTEKTNHQIPLAVSLDELKEYILEGRHFAPELIAEVSAATSDLPNALLEQVRALGEYARTSRVLNVEQIEQLTRQIQYLRQQVTPVVPNPDTVPATAIPVFEEDDDEEDDTELNNNDEPDRDEDGRRIQ